MLEKNWQKIKERVIVPLWHRRFKSMYESAKLDYDDFESLAGFELSKALINFDSDKSNIFTYATEVITKKAMTELRDCTRRDKRRVLHIAESVDALDATVPEKMSYSIDTDITEDALSEKMKLYLSKLSTLQKDILYAMSEGYTNEEIIMRLRITDKQRTEALSAIKSYRNVSILY